MMDQFLWGEVNRISPEAPVPVVKVEKETFLLGGAANVVNNLLGLKARVLLAGVIGSDGMGRRLMRRLQGLGTSTEGIVVEDDRPTAIKTRIIAHHQQVVRVDREQVNPIRGESLRTILGVVQKNLAEISGIIVSDYGKGVVSKEMMARLRAMAHKASLPILVDPKPQNIRWYEKVTMVTPNHIEAGQSLGKRIEKEEDLIFVGRQLLRRLKCESVLITRGRDGMTLFSRNRPHNHIPTVAKKVFDVTGAGDTVIASLMIALAAGLNLIQACVAANYAAGIVVGEVGTAAIQAEDLKRVLLEAKNY
jgi:D-beta-D-heptose 7-phosphate kinase/D-beta-D-heptose 1-phosphate adenosyltransferase